MNENFWTSLFKNYSVIFRGQVWIVCFKKTSKQTEQYDFPLELIVSTFCRDRSNMKDSLGHSENQLAVSSDVHNSQAGVTICCNVYI